MLDRRQFTAGLAATALAAAPVARAVPAYAGPNVILVRFGGGVRRSETIAAGTSFAPYLLNALVPRGVLIPDMTIAQLDGVETSHAEGTVNLLTGRYRAYRDGGTATFDDLEPTEPTLFEYLRRSFGVPAHQALLVNGEDRPQEENLAYGVHRSHGVAFRSEVLSLMRFKLWKLRTALAEGAADEAAMAELARLEARARPGAEGPQAPEIDALWQRWQAFYGYSGLLNPRGDAALTELALWALRDLRPRLMMVNYQDPDYVHWGNATHYTRAITEIDRGLERLVTAVDADPEYRGRTLFVIVPDCGRDANPLMGVPFQHHFNSRSAHEIWALVFGPGIVQGRVWDRPADQTAIAPTIAAAMGFAATRAESGALDGIFT